MWSRTMDAETRKEIVLHAVRWATNMLVEVLSNHGAYLYESDRVALKQATLSLCEITERRD